MNCPISGRFIRYSDVRRGTISQLKLSMCLSTEAAKFDAVAFKGDFKTNVARIAALGYDGVEIAVRDPKRLDHGTVLETVVGNGLTIPAIGTGQAWGEEGLSYTDPDPKIREQAVLRTIDHIALARKAHAVIIIGLLRGIVREGLSRQLAEQWLVEALVYVTTEAAKSGVRIALEPINRYETTLINQVAEGLELIETVGADNLGLLLDTFHMNIEEPSIEESIGACGERIFHFHVADSNRWYPGAGHLDFRSILRSLLDTGYTGFISGEHRPDPAAEIAARRGIDYLRALKL